MKYKELTKEQEDFVLESSREEYSKEDNFTSLDEFYFEHRDEVIKEFRDDWKRQEMDEPLPENDEDLENWYGEQLKEITKEWYEYFVDEINTKR